MNYCEFTCVPGCRHEALRSSRFIHECIQMPFTLAHPAAVLPLRHWCPRPLSFPALVAGSLSPDAGYCLGHSDLDVFSHSFAGSVVFCLPVGVLLLAVFHVFRSYAVRDLPARAKENVRDLSMFAPTVAFSPVIVRPRWKLLSGAASAAVVVLSILVGAWTHIMWDSFTNNEGWVGARVPALQTPLLLLAGHQVRICHLLWYACSFAGVAWLWLAYANRNQSEASVRRIGLNGANFWKAALWGALVLPIGAAHHLVHGLAGFLLVAGLSALFIFIVILNTPQISSLESPSVDSSAPIKG